MKNRAIVNVSDASLLAEFSRELVELGYEILCSNENVSILKENEVEHTAISDDSHVGADIGVKMEVMRSEIFAAILADRSDTEHISTIISSGLEPIDIVITNFDKFDSYSEEMTPDIKNIFSDIDINKSSLIKAGVSNCDDVCVVVDPSDYETVLNEIKKYGEVSKKTRLKFAVKALSYLCARDTLISSYLNMRIGEDSYPEMLNFSYEKLTNLNCGVNSHQTAALYRNLATKSKNICNMEKLQGDVLSLVGYNDADIAIEAVSGFEECSVAVANNGCLCGVGIGEDIYEACSNAFKPALHSINGSVAVFNRAVDRRCALELVKHTFGGVIAPEYGVDTEDILSSKEGLNLFILKCAENKPYNIKIINGGLLIQKNKDMIESVPELQCVTLRKPEEWEKKDLLFAWKVTKNVKSSAVVIAKNGQTIGIGGGQPKHITSFEIALKNAGQKAKESVVAIDGMIDTTDFFDLIYENGITAVIQSGTFEIPDEIIDFCNNNGITMLMTNIQNSKL